MSVAPRPMSQGAPPPLAGGQLRRPERTIGSGNRPPPTRGALIRRRLLVGGFKRLLPLVALGLLVLVAMWPEIGRQADRARMSWRVTQSNGDIGQLTDARYHGVDEHGQPYTITAAAARQIGDDRVDMTAPVGDLSLQSGGWAMAEGDTGVYMQKGGQLDLSGNVQLYRDDGTVLQTDAASVDTKEGAAASAERTHVEGPFGTLDAQGFSLVDRGNVVHFNGPGRMVLNGGRK